jgi:hypothetical protein
VIKKQKRVDITTPFTVAPPLHLFVSVTSDFV